MSIDKTVKRLDNVTRANGLLSAVNVESYTAWLHQDGSDAALRFNHAVVMFLGAKAVAEANEHGCLPELLDWALQQGKRKYGEVDLHAILIRHQSPALAYCG